MRSQSKTLTIGGRWGRLLAPLAMIGLVFSVLAPTGQAAAVGPGGGVVSAAVTFLTPAGAPISVVDPLDPALSPTGQYRIDVSFSCSVANCDNTTVVMSPNPRDPYYNQFILEAAGYTFTPPFPGATSSGSPAAGITVNLGNLTAGQNGVFQLYYKFQNRPGLPTPGSPGSFFPNGYVIQSTATIDSSSVAATSVATASATWVSRTGAPVFGTGAPASTRTDTPISISVGAYGACNYINGYNYGTEVYQCAKSFTLTSTLPAGAQYVAGSATSGGVYDAATRTITWTGADTTAATVLARGPLARYYQVTFPSSGMPTTGAGCVAPQTFTSTFQLVLLDGTVQNPAPTSATVQAQNCDPFSGMITPVKSSTLNAGSAANPIVWIPLAGAGANARNWTVTAGNTANVAGVATITDPDLDQADMPVYQIYNPGTPTMTVQYTLKDAGGATTTGTVTLATGQGFSAPAGRRVVAVTATSSSLIGPNPSPASQTASTNASIAFYYAVSPGVTPGPRTNTATVTMSYPGYALTPLTGTATRTVTLQATPASIPTLNVGAGGPTVTGGGNIVTGSEVTWAVNGSVTTAPNNNSIVPQYVFMAPFGWNVTSTAWSAAPPAGTTVVQRQVTIAGQLRNIVVATWPAALSIPVGGSSGALPSLYAVTRPTSAAPAGTNTATMLFGDANDGVASYSPNTYNEATNGVDLTGDGTATDKFAIRGVNATVLGTPSLSVLKEICRPDGAGGCIWIANSNATVGVPPGAGSIQYRITVTNTGQATATNVIAYDVLPYVGDVGTSNATVGTPRGSTVKEALASVSGVPADVTLDYSTSTNPPRVVGVYSGATTGTWTSGPVVGASALRATIASLPAGASRTFTYEASLVGGSADKIACNSVAAIATSLTAVEPAPVCATTQEADLSVVAGDRFPLQVGRVGIVPFVVNNGGGSQLATGTVTINVPADLTIATLTIPNWLCTSPSLTGPVTVTCDPVDGGGLTRQLQMDVPETIPLQVTPSAAIVGDRVCFDAEITGIMSDPNLTNNNANVCSDVFDSATLLAVTKTDGETVATVGELLTYTITARNYIVDQPLTAVQVTDVLPANVEWVSGGTVSGQDADGLGGTVTFAATDLTTGGTSTAAGDNGTTNAGNTATFTVTVRVAANATGDVVNAATAKATDPVAATPLTATADDTDELLRSSVTKASNAAPAGVRDGDTVTYTVTLTNDGTSDYTSGNPARVIDDLSAVLDDATYVSGTVAVAGGAPSPISPNGSNRITWSGALAAGTSTVIVYSVLVGAGADEVLTNTAFASGAVGTCVNGEDQDGISCDTVQSIYAPLIGKRIQSYTQNDDGTFTIVYAVDVTNPSPIGTSTYSVTDSLRLGAGITVISASAAMPAGVTAALPAWSGSGALANNVSIAGGAQQTYVVTVIADAQQVAGTAAAVCATGVVGGFANQATITIAGLSDVTAEACATPVKPTIQKTVSGAPTQQPDGSWNVTYTVTVRNANPAPATLAYTIQDALAFAPGTSVNSVQVTGPGASATFNGAGDQALLSAVGHIPAPSGGATSTTQVFTVVVNANAPVGAVTPADLLCSTPGGGYANGATLFAGTSTTVLGTATACASITVAPLPTITKSVISSSVDVSGDWTVVYGIDVTNPDGTFATFYNMDDELDFAAGFTVASATVSSAPGAVTPNPLWDGDTDTQIGTGIALAAGQTHSYQVTVVTDPGTVDPETAVADCLVDSGESGTGFRNIATVAAGVKSAFAAACEPFTDPSVVKTTVGQPTQNTTTGVWTLQYQITVTNRSVSTTGTIPYTLEDELGFPADVTIVNVAATAPAGGSVNPTFNGVGDKALGSGAIGAAADASTPATQVYTVTVQFRVPAGITTGLACDPAQGPGGLRNEIAVVVGGPGGRESGAVACVDVPDVPAPVVTKTVLSQTQQADGTWVVLYRIVVDNPSGTSASEYTLDDTFALGTGITLDSTPTIVANPAGVTVEPTWDGAGNSTIAENIILPGAGSHTYTVRAVIDSGSVSGSDPAGDCVLDAGETSTGFGNGALLDTGATTVDAAACAQAWDPAVTKDINGQPVRQADGSWLLSYTMTVTNPSAVNLAYGLVDELDFPTGTVVTVVSAAGRAGAATVESDWDGDTQTQLVADGSPLPANAIHVYDVTLRAVLPATQGSQADGWGNAARVLSGVNGVIESEDEALADIALPELELTKVATPPAGLLRIGDVVQYEITVDNVGAGDFTSLAPAIVWDAMAGVLDDADVDAVPAATPNVGTIVDTGAGYNWTGPLASGDQVTIVYSVVITGGGDADMLNVAFQPAIGDTNPTTPDVATCTSPLCAFTQTPLAALSITKAVDVTKVNPGGAVRYSVTVTNTGLADIPSGDPAVVTDDLSGVLNNASFVGTPTASTGTTVLIANTLTWTGGLNVGDTATITYSVTANSGAASGTKLVNLAVSDPTLPVIAAAGGGADASTETTIVRLALTGEAPSLLILLLALGLLSAGVAIIAARVRRSRRAA